MEPEPWQRKCQGQRLKKHPWSRCNRVGVVWLVASCRQMLISVCWDWALVLGSTRSSSCLAAEVHSKWCRLDGGIVFAVAVSDCWDWALAVWARARSSSCLAAEVHSSWCRLVGGIVLAVAMASDCKLIGLF